MKKFFGEIFKDTLAIVLGALCYAAGLCVFVQPFDMLSGGASGVAIIINRFFDIPVGSATFLVNIPIFIWAFFVCGKKYTLKIIYSCLLFSSVIDLFSAFSPYNYTGDKVLCALCGGVLMGIGLYIMMMRSIVTGGSDLLAYIIQRKHPAYSISVLVTVIDVVIILFGALVFKSVDAALYSVLLTVVLTLVLDTLLRGRSNGSLYFIFTDNPADVSALVLKNLDRGLTRIEVKGGYTGKPRDMLMCAVNRRQSGYLKKLVFEADPNAFVIVGNADSVFGNGFTIPGKEDIF